MADKKIAIMTWLYNGNYGTLLQAKAMRLKTLITEAH